MNECIESLPNEIFMNIFKYLNVRSLFKAFYNLNSRFNSLLESCDNYLTIPTKDLHELEFSFPYIRTLIANDDIDIPANQLINLRRAVLHPNSRVALQNFLMNLTSNIESLTVWYWADWMLILPNDVARKIFSNGFPGLKSCCLSDKIYLFDAEGWKQSPSLHIFQIGVITFDIYMSILESCPNLYSIRFRTPLDDQTTISTEKYVNLKRMMITLYANSCLNENRFSHYLLLVPKLEQLTIDLLACDHEGITRIENYGCFAPVIDRCLPMLGQFHCYVTFEETRRISKSKRDDLIEKFKENFYRAHNNRYKSKIVVRL